jgi:hypothetical protein
MTRNRTSEIEQYLDGNYSDGGSGYCSTRQAYSRAYGRLKRAERGAEARAVEARAVEARAVEARTVEAMAVEARAVEARAVEARAVEARAVEATNTEAKVINKDCIDNLKKIVFTFIYFIFLIYMLYRRNF